MSLAQILPLPVLGYVHLSLNDLGMLHLLWLSQKSIDQSFYKDKELYKGPGKDRGTTRDGERRKGEIFAGEKEREEIRYRRGRK